MMCKKSITSFLARGPCNSNKVCLLCYIDPLDLRIQKFLLNYKNIHDIFMSAIISLFSDQKYKAAIQYAKMGTAVKCVLIPRHEIVLLKKPQNPCFQMKNHKFFIFIS